MRADAQAKQADTKIKHLQKQLLEQRKLQRTKQKEADSLQANLEKEQKAVQSCEER